MLRFPDNDVVKIGIIVITTVEQKLESRRIRRRGET